jgi:hypothetical protein
VANAVANDSTADPATGSTPAAGPGALVANAAANDSTADPVTGSTMTPVPLGLANTRLLPPPPPPPPTPPQSSATSAGSTVPVADSAVTVANEPRPMSAQMSRVGARGKGTHVVEHRLPSVGRGI